MRQIGRVVIIALGGIALLSGCSSNPGIGSGGQGPAAGGATGTGGVRATGGSAIGGIAMGGSAMGGSAMGGSAMGGQAGGTPGTGGGAPGTGGAVGGSATGGARSGGASGGTASGGTATGGAGGGSSGGGNAAGGSSGGGSSGEGHWVGTWTASPYPIPSDGQPKSPLSNSVVRQVAHVSLGGSQIRVQFSNLSGDGPVTIKSAHVALCKAAPAVDGSIDTATDKALAFSGAESVTIAQGKEIWSDPLSFTVANQGNLSLTTAFGSVPSNLTGHSGARTTSYQVTNSTAVNVADMTASPTGEHWYYLSGIDVMANGTARGVVAIGDSITDGRGTDTNHNNRWTDVLAARLAANAATANVATMNQGIGATTLIGTGTAAETRFARDVLGQSGVKYAIVYDGVNDIGSSGASFAAMKTVYDKLIAAAHAKNVVIVGATIPPFGENSYYSTAHESVRQQVNTYIKSGVFDGIIDFDAALTDGGNPPKLKDAYAAWSQRDGLHPGPAGYQKMGDTPDLALFTK